MERNTKKVSRQAAKAWRSAKHGGCKAARRAEAARREADREIDIWRY